MERLQAPPHRIGASAAQPSTGGRCLREGGVVSDSVQEMVFHRAPPGGAGHPAARASVAGARLGTKRPTTEEVLLERGWLVGGGTPRVWLGSLIRERSLES